MKVHIDIQAQTKEDVILALQDMAQKLMHQDTLPATHHSAYHYRMKKNTSSTVELTDDAIVNVQGCYYRLCVQHQLTPTFRLIGNRLYAKYAKMQTIQLTTQSVDIWWKGQMYTLSVSSGKPVLFFPFPS